MVRPIQVASTLGDCFCNSHQQEAWYAVQTFPDTPWKSLPCSLFELLKRSSNLISLIRTRRSRWEWTGPCVKDTSGPRTRSTAKSTEGCSTPIQLLCRPGSYRVKVLPIIYHWLLGLGQKFWVLNWTSSTTFGFGILLLVAPVTLENNPEIALLPVGYWRLNKNNLFVAFPCWIKALCARRSGPILRKYTVTFITKIGHIMLFFTLTR